MKLFLLCLASLGHTPNSEGPPGVDQENPVNTEGTQKKQGPKEKTPAGRRRKEIVPQTPPQHDNSAASDTPELTSSGRPKRRAAKVYVSQNPYNMYTKCTITCNKTSC